MRSIRLMAATTVIVALASACGDSGVGPNNPPVADFTAPSCTAGAPCAFTSTSTDDTGITAYLWTFGDANAPVADQTSTLPNPSHTYSVAGTYTVSLMVTDGSGATNTKTNTVTVAPGTPTNQPPVASFTAPTSCTVNAACAFTSTSTDADGTITLTRWDFGGGVTLDGQSVTHTYTSAGTFNVILTVTDNLGATGTVTQPVTVAAPTTQPCSSTDVDEIDCTLTMTQRATLTVTLTSISCELGSSRVFIPLPEPAAQPVFTNVCFREPGLQYTLLDNAGAPLVFEAGAAVHIRFQRGTGDPPPGSPQGNVAASGSTWTINIDDGGNPGGPGEPDFNDVVLTIQATPR
jgi:PKD repeat protein